MQTHIQYATCGTAVNHNLDELARGRRIKKDYMREEEGERRGGAVVEACFTVSYIRLELRHTGYHPSVFNCVSVGLAIISLTVRVD